MTTEMGLDSNNAEVELRYRIVNKLKSGKPGSLTFSQPSFLFVLGW
jgi:hypothetical protein